MYRIHTIQFRGCRFGCIRLGASLLLLLLLLVACGYGGSAHHGTDRFSAVLLPPPGVPIEQLQALGGADRYARADLSEALGWARSQAQVVDGPATRLSADPSVDPLAEHRAVCLYAEALDLSNTRHAQALRQAAALVCEAYRLDPQAGAVAALGGRIALLRGDRRDAVQWYERLLAIDPSHDQSQIARLVVGRQAMLSSRNAEAIRLLSEVCNSEQPLPPSVRALGRFYLAESLIQSGFIQAGVQALGGFLNMPVTTRRNTVFDDEWHDIAQRRVEVLMVMADGLLRLDQPQRALQIYDLALREPQAEVSVIVGRQIYALAMMGKQSAGEQLAWMHAGASGFDRSSVRLLFYAGHLTGRRETLMEQVSDYYRQHGRPGVLAVAMADELKPASARRLLIGHLDHSPADPAVLKALVQRAGAGAASVQLDALIRRALAEEPEQAWRLSRYLLMDSGAGVARLLLAEYRMGRLKAEDASSLFWQGQLAAASGYGEWALRLYRRALAHQPTYQPARLAMARLLLDMGRADMAGRPLIGLDDSINAVALLHARRLWQLGRVDEARVGLDQCAQQQLSLVDSLDLVQLWEEMGRIHEARLLLDELLDQYPDEPTVYTTLLRLFEGHARYHPGRYRVLYRLAGRMPGAMSARLAVIRFHAEQGRMAQALALLKLMLVEYPQQPELLNQWVVWQMDERVRPEVRKQLHQQVADPSDRVLLIARLDWAFGHRARAVARLRAALAAAETRRMDLLVVCTRRLAELGRMDQARSLLGQCISDFPTQQDQIAYLQGKLWYDQAQYARAQACFARALQINPTRHRAAHGLACVAMARHRYLEAEPWARQAVEIRPKSALYLDTLGWVLYKLGRFDAAIGYLKQASTSADGPQHRISEHLGDAYWRVGKLQQAQRCWVEALMISPVDDAGSQVSIQRLRGKLEAVRADRQPTVAPIAVPVPDVPQTDYPATSHTE